MAMSYEQALAHLEIGRHLADGEPARRTHLLQAEELFARLDRLILLAAPGFDIVLRWRIEQEHQLRRERGGGMSDGEVARFIQHYERLSRHILAEMPGRADLVIPLAEDRTPIVRE